MPQLFCLWHGWIGNVDTLCPERAVKMEFWDSPRVGRYQGSSKLDGCRPLAFIVFFSRNFFLNDDTSGQITFLSQRTNIETRESVQLFEYRPNLIQYKNLSYNIRRIQEFRLELDIKYSFNDLVKLASLLIFIIILFDTV